MNIPEFCLRYNQVMSTQMDRTFLENNRCLDLVRGDLTEERVDVIVNAANRWLQHGGGVAGAIIRKGGMIIQKESDDWVARHGPITQDHPAFTNSGNLPCHFIIHAVGPVWGEGAEPE